LADLICMVVLACSGGNKGWEYNTPSLVN